MPLSCSHLVLALVLLLTLAGHAPAALASGVALGGLLPGGGVVHKPLVTVRDRPFQNLVRQETDYSCGAASLATILKYAYGIETGEAEVVQGMLALSDPEVVRRQGFSLLNLRDYTASLGFEGRGFQVSVEALRNARVPTIVLLDIRGYKHFVVLKKVRGDRAYIADPALGNLVLPLAEFEAGWNGVVFAVIGEGYDEHTVLRNPPPPLSAARLLSVNTRMPETPLVEFGFLHADLF